MQVGATLKSWFEVAHQRGLPLCKGEESLSLRLLQHTPISVNTVAVHAACWKA